jgi:hypothetical protein
MFDLLLLLGDFGSESILLFGHGGLIPHNQIRAHLLNLQNPMRKAQACLRGKPCQYVIRPSKLNVNSGNVEP